MESGKRPAPEMADLELTAAHSVYSRYWRMGYAPEVLLNARDLSLIPGVVEAISNFILTSMIFQVLTILTVIGSCFLRLCNVLL